MSGRVLWMLGGCIQLLLLSSVRCSIDGVITTVEESFQPDLTDSAVGKSLSSLWYDYKVAGSSDSFIKLQLDMMITKETYERLIDDQEFELPRKRRNAVQGSARLWPDGRIPYKLDANYTTEDKLEITMAMQHWMAHTCVVFEPATDEDFNLITFVAVENVCESVVGMMQGNQPINLAPGCRKTDIVVHEIGHALGLFHEHMRDDRDPYVTINYENINETLHYNFYKMYKDEYDDYDKPYDYRSIMHYSKFAFSLNPTENLTTIIPTDPEYMDIIGEVTEASFLDFEIVNRMYKCSAGCMDKDCPEGSFQGKQCKCYCNSNGRVVRCSLAAKCSAPQLDRAVYAVYMQDFRVITNLDRKFPNGTKLLVNFKDRSCGDHYMDFTCIQGQWQGDTPVCLEEKSCGISESWLGAYSVEELGEFNDTEDDGNNMTMITQEEYILSRHQVRFTCRDYPELSNILTCQSGNWSEEPIVCVMKEKSCGISESWLGAYSVEELGEFNDTEDDGNNMTMITQEEFILSRHQVRFTCRDYPELSNILTCQSGNWSEEPIVCVMKEKSCGISESWLGAYSVEELGEFNDTEDDGNNMTMITQEEFILSRHQVRFTCRDYPELSNILTCQSGNWSEEPIVCVMKDCKVENGPEGFYTLSTDGQKQKEGDTAPHGTLMLASCDNLDYSGGEMFVETNMMCNNGEWDNDPPQNCSKGPKDCPQIINATVVGSFLGGVDVTCISGYTLSTADVSQFTCSHVGEWEPFRPYCNPKGCVVSLNGSRASVTNRDNVQLSSGAPIDHADSVNVTCPHGMFPDLVTATCQLGYWDTETEQLPQCKQVDCPRLSSSRRLSYKPNLRKYVYKDKISMSKCRGNLEFYGEKELTCTQHGNWSGIAGCRKYCRNGNDSFIDVKGHTLRAKIIKVLQLGRFSAKQCKEKCTRERRFLCMSVTYGYSNKKRRYICNLYKTDPMKAPRLKGSKQFWTLSYRSCSPVIHVDKQT